MSVLDVFLHAIVDLLMEKTVVWIAQAAGDDAAGPAYEADILAMIKSPEDVTGEDGEYRLTVDDDAFVETWNWWICMLVRGRKRAAPGEDWRSVVNDTAGKLTAVIVAGGGRLVDDEKVSEAVSREVADGVLRASRGDGLTKKALSRFYDHALFLGAKCKPVGDSTAVDGSPKPGVCPMLGNCLL